ncbi:hypothetical protein LTR10_004238 [Elasticomyces elasticus]|nr:hypothetical protein LTR10_004238 [Elasticomyces elasticus]
MAHKKSKTSTKQQIPQASNSTAHILRLPVELIEYIGHTARRKDLLALRQTCRDIRDGIQRPFARVYFVEKTFMLPDPESMSALKYISEHVIFRKEMRKITFVSSKHASTSLIHLLSNTRNHASRKALAAKNSELRCAKGAVVALNCQ